MFCIGGDNSVRMEFWLPTSNKLFKDILKCLASLTPSSSVKLVLEFTRTGG